MERSRLRGDPKPHTRPTFYRALDAAFGGPATVLKTRGPNVGEAGTNVARVMDTGTAFAGLGLLWNLAILSPSSASWPDYS